MSKRVKPIGNQLAVLGLLFDGRERTARELTAEAGFTYSSASYCALTALQKSGYVLVVGDANGRRTAQRFRISESGREVYLEQAADIEGNSQWFTRSTALRASLEVGFRRNLAPRPDAASAAAVALLAARQTDDEPEAGDGLRPGMHVQRGSAGRVLGRIGEVEPTRFSIWRRGAATRWIASSEVRRIVGDRVFLRAG